MGVRVEYEIRKLSDEYVTKEMHVAYEQDPTSKDAKGYFRNKRVEKEVEVRGGYLLMVRDTKGKISHSVRLQNEAQPQALIVSLQPRLINTETGEECDRNGIPLSVVNVIGSEAITENAAAGIDGEADSQLDLDLHDPAEAAVGDVVKGLE
jgi:hypothetical protein